MDQRRNKTENQKTLGDKWKWKHNHAKPVGCSKHSAKRKVYSDTILPQEGRKITNLRKPDIILKGLEKEQAKLKVSRREGVKKIRTKINEIEMKKTIEKNQWN